jgi:hypothetical protein
MATSYVMLSFEGPDVYSRAGGLGVRAAELANALASRGAQTDLYFVGDPELAPTETPASAIIPTASTTASGEKCSTTSARFRNTSWTRT